MFNLLNSASNALQYVGKNLHILIQSCFSFLVPPSISGGSGGPVEKKVVASKALTLECEAGGHPLPSLTWLKDGSPVKSGDNLKVLEQGRKIQIINAAPSDAGRYVCVATSAAGEMEIKYDVNVLGK